MNRRSIARAAAAVTSLGVGAVLALTGSAAAEPVAPSPVDIGLAELTDTAGTDTAAQAGVASLQQYTELVDVSELRDIAGTFIPFAYAAPTFGCGSNGPITTIIAAATTIGPPLDEGVNSNPGTLRFSATPAHSGSPLASGLTVAWVNINTGASGIDMLDDKTEMGLPTLSKTVASGPGTVLASMWGIIDYPFAHCVMTPTVGIFEVPNAPAPAPAAPAPSNPGAAQPAPR
ncbi:hypothetical protein ACFQZZ_20640 [Nocardia sp. GCM10030253]|uniref:hypothetical protein n=1 Tax=Nocardia sp. GCM10030253 TaxID=3273404 RepID=UPI003631004F